MSNQRQKTVTCKICGKKYIGKQALIDHIEKSHSASIPEGFTAARYENYLRTGKTEGRCIYCHKPTGWNPVTGKYNRMCGSDACKKKAYDLAQKNYIGKHGKVYSINNPEQQKKMVYGRKNSGEYVFVDTETGKKYKAMYDSSYGKDFFEMLDTFLGWDGADIIAPSPHTYYYTYEGKEHFYIPDAYSTSLNLEIELKDGGDNPNMHPKIQSVDKVKEKLKDEVMESLKDQVNYIKICNKDYSGFFALLSELRAKDFCPLPKWEKKLEPALESWLDEELPDTEESVEESVIVSTGDTSKEVFTAYYISEKKDLKGGIDEEQYYQKLSDAVNAEIEKFHISEETSMRRYVYTLGKDYAALRLGIIEIHYYPFIAGGTYKWVETYGINRAMLMTDKNNPYTDMVYEAAGLDDILSSAVSLVDRDIKLKDPMLNYDDLVLHYRKKLFHQKLTKSEWIALQAELEDVQEYLKRVVNGNGEEDKRMKYEARKALKEVTRFLGYMSSTKPTLEATEEITQRLYHLSTKPLDGKTLEPYIPENYKSEHGFEDNKTKRVEFYLNVDDALMAREEEIAEMDFYVYEPDGIYNVYVAQSEDRNQIRYIPEAGITHEMWIEEPVKLNLVGKVHVISKKLDDDVIYEFDNKQIAKLHRWVWKWMDIVDEETEITESFKSNGHKNLSDFKCIRITEPSIEEYKRRYKNKLKFVVTADDGAIWVDNDKTLVAMVALDKSEHPHWIYDLVVSPEYRGYGLGNQVLDYTVKKLGGEALSVRKGNDVAFNMYKKYGFKTKVISNGSKDLNYMYLNDAVVESANDPNRPVIHKPDLTKAGEELDYHKTPEQMMEFSLSSTMVQDFQAKGSRQLSEFTKMTINRTIIDKYKVRYPHLKHIRVDGANGYLWFEQNELVAYVAVDFGGSKKWIQALYVSPDYRGYGLSKQLLKIAENELNATHLSVAKNNEVAINLYKKNGWKEDNSINKSEHMLFMTNGRGSHLPVTEGQVFNEPDVYYNKEAFDNGDINVCFITGLSGSGKTTMASGMTKDFYQLDDVLAQYNFSDDNLKEYGPVISGFFSGTGKKYRAINGPDDMTEKEERGVIRDFVTYATKYASSHKDVKVIIEGVELFWFFEPSELKDYAVYIKGTSALLSQIRGALRDSSDADSKPERVKAFFKIMLRKGRASAYSETEKKIKKWRDYFKKQETVTESSTLDTSNVYYTDEITPESLVRIYHMLGVNLPGKVAVKISTGEPGGHNFLKPSLIKDLVNEVNGTIVECNTAYPGKRNTPKDHWQAIKDHGFADIAPCMIMDEKGEISLPVKDGYHLKENLVGEGIREFDSMIVLSHFKGPAMAGYGGALKNMSIGVASAHGKTNIHTAGMGTTFEDLMTHDRTEFQESMADADKSVMDYFGRENIVYINVANNLSVDCDCDAHPHDPEMKDIGIFASIDPVAVDQACVDAIYTSEDEGKHALIERIESRNGIHTIEAAYGLGLGNRNYNLLMNSSLSEASYIEATKNEGRYFPVFIFLSYTGTNMAKFIKAFTHDPYAHSSISFDTNLDNMISFNRDGMVTEDIRKNVYKKNEKNIRYSLYMYMATAQEYDAMKEFVEQLEMRKHKLKYNILGLTNFIFGQGSEREDRFFCSEFVASVIGAGNAQLIKTRPYLTTPYNLTKNRNFIFIKTGILKNYDKNVIDKLIAEKLEEGGFQNVVIK